MSSLGEARDMETAIIPKGTVINGNIDIKGKLEMHGVINGDINSDSLVNLCGNVTGNINVNELHTRDSFVVGRIACLQNAVVQDNTVILGDVNAQNLTVDGAIQGKIDIRNQITVGNKAIIDSDIKAKSIQVNNGASINGSCSLCYADVKAKDFFHVTDEPAANAPVSEEVSGDAADAESESSNGKPVSAETEALDDKPDLENAEISDDKPVSAEIEEPDNTSDGKTDVGDNDSDASAEPQQNKWQGNGRNGKKYYKKGNHNHHR